jgi:hypothetical protein
MPHKRLLIGLIAASLVLAAGVVLFVERPKKAPVARPAPVERGAILDFDGVPLTGSMTVWDAAIDFRAVRKLPADAVARLFEELPRRLGLDIDLASAIAVRPDVDDWRLPIELSEQQMRDAVSWHRASEWRAIPHLVRFAPRAKRTYPAGRATSQVVGFAGRDGKGLEGLELQFDRALTRGFSVRISLESKVQSAIVELLEPAMRAQGLREVNVVTLDLRSGRVRSIVSLPAFDPADSRSRVGEHVRLRAVTDIFQTGPLLQPFLLSALLRERLTAQEPRLTQAFIAGNDEAGVNMVEALGRRTSLYRLEDAGLLGRQAVEFPGTVSAIVRTEGCPDELTRDLGHGAGVATPLIQYASALLGELGGTRPRPLKLGYALADSDTLWPPFDEPRDPTAAALVERLVARARRQSGNPNANIGGLWATYEDRAAEGKGPARAALALFAPADAPTQLVVMTLRVGEREFSEDALLDIGEKVLDVVMKR